MSGKEVTHNQHKDLERVSMKTAAIFLVIFAALNAAEAYAPRKSLCELILFFSCHLFVCTLLTYRMHLNSEQSQNLLLSRLRSSRRV